jgi:hypothetical protein
MVVVEADDEEFWGDPTFHPCCWSSWVKWAAVLAIWVPLATTTFTVPWATVEVVATGGWVVAVVVVGVDEPLK